MKALTALALTACGDRGASGFCGEILAPFPVNIVVLTANEDAPTADSFHPSAADPARTLSGEAVLRGEIDILNTYFRDVSGDLVCEGDDCVTFELADLHFRADIANTTCAELLAFGDMTERRYLDPTDPDYTDLNDGIEAAIWACEERRMVAPTALNLYVYDEHRWDADAGVARPSGINSRGRSAERGGVYQPYAVLDLARLQHTTQSPEEHEVGHALSLNHVCDPDVAQVSSDSNIMGSTCAPCDGGPESPSGGARNLGFTRVTHDVRDCEVDQVARIIQRAREIQAAWCRVPSSSGRR